MLIEEMNEIKWLKLCLSFRTGNDAVCDLRVHSSGTLLDADHVYQLGVLHLLLSCVVCHFWASGTRW